MEPRYFRLVTGILLSAGLLHAAQAIAQEKVYRWVDENGEVHYTQSLPPDFKDKGHDVLDKDGLVRDKDVSLTPEYKQSREKTGEEKDKNLPPELPRDSSGLPRPRALYTEEETQKRMDAFLMLRYHSEDEILEAMNVEIRQLEYDRRLLQTSRTSISNAWRGHISQAANKQRAGLEVLEKDGQEIRNLQQRLNESKVELDRLKVREANIRADFQVQLDRYRHLVEQYNPSNS